MPDIVLSTHKENPIYSYNHLKTEITALHFTNGNTCSRLPSDKH